MGWKQPPSDIILELAPNSELSPKQIALYKKIRELWAANKKDIGLKVYVLGYGEPSNLDQIKKIR